MTDVLEDIIKKICYKLKLAYEDDLSEQSTGFPVLFLQYEPSIFIDLNLFAECGRKSIC